MFSIDLKDVYLQVSVHPDSPGFLTVAFKILCIGITTAPQVFTKVMAPACGVCILGYMDVWLVLASFLP